MSQILQTVFVVSLALAASRTASADPKDDAKPHVERAMQLYQEGKTAEALEELTIANQIDPTPELLYAIAQAHVVLEHCDVAIKYYEQFIATKPKEGPEKLAREAIDHCKTILNKTEPTPTPPPTPPPVREAPPDPVDHGPTTAAWYANPVAIGLVGGGVVAGIASFVLYRSARSDFDDAQTAPDYASHHALIEDSKTTRTYAVIAGVGGLILASAGVAYFAVKDRSTKSDLAIAPTRGGGVMTWSRRF